jgi:hypothetical protein
MESTEPVGSPLTRPAIAMGLVTIALATTLAVFTDPPLAVPVLLFGALYFFAENIDLEVPSGAGLSGGFMITIATIVVFCTDQTPLGVLLVGLCGGLYLPHLKRRDWRKIVYNTGAYGIAMLLGYVVLSAFPASWLASTPLLLLAALPTALAYFAANVLAVSFAVARLRGEPMRRVFRQLAGWQFHIYPFAFLGVVIGRLYLDVGVAVVPLVVVPILVARHAYASYLRLREANEAALATLVRALETKDRYTAGHAERVAVYASYIGEELGMRPRALERLRQAALMHDIGKLVVPNQLLNKPGRLTAVEYDVVRRHEDLSIRLLERIDFLAPVAPIAIGVYAPLDGGNDKGRIEPYIIGVADAFDAMTSTRAYRLALTQEIAFAELRRHSGKQFHPRCVEALIQAIERRRENHGAGYESAAALAEWTTVPPDSGPGSAGLGDFAVDGSR